MRTASKFGAILPKFHQIPAYVALFREKSLNRYFSPPVVVPKIIPAVTQIIAGRGATAPLHPP